MTGQQTMTAGAPGQELTAPGPGRDVAAGPGSSAAGSAGSAGSGGVLPEGVLARVTPAMAAAIGTVAAVAMAEAAFNLGRAVYTILQLPLPLAIGFPAIFEAAAGSFAVQDMRDRRAGHASRAMRAATYLTLVASSIVNGIVGWLAHGGAGLVEILPPLVLAGVIHLHGDRATRAHHSQAVLRPAWRQAQLDAARQDAVLDVLPLLAGDDADGRATVALLRRWMDSGTLQPGDALLAAGWHARAERAMDASRLRRLETVAAAVWGPAGPPAPAPQARAGHPQQAGAGAARPGPAGGSTARPARPSTPGSGPGSTPKAGPGSTGGSMPGSTGTTGGSVAGPAGAGQRSIQELRARTVDDLIGELEDQVAAGTPVDIGSAKSIREHLQCSPERSRALRDHFAGQPATPEGTAAAPPQLKLLHAEPAGPAELDRQPGGQPGQDHQAADDPAAVPGREAL